MIIRVSGDLDSGFQGTCARVADGVAQYTAQTTTSGTPKIKPAVEISIPLVGTKKMGPLTVTVPIKAISSKMNLDSFSDNTLPAAAPRTWKRPLGLNPSAFHSTHV